MYGPKWSFLLRYGSRNTRRIDFPRVDGLSTDTPVLELHKVSFIVFSYSHKYLRETRFLISLVRFLIVFIKACNLSKFFQNSSR